VVLTPPVPTYRNPGPVRARVGVQIKEGRLAKREPVPGTQSVRTAAVPAGLPMVETPYMLALHARLEQLVHRHEVREDLSGNLTEGEIRQRAARAATIPQ
jgi:hypothetical protein